MPSLLSLRIVNKLGSWHNQSGSVKFEFSNRTLNTFILSCYSQCLTKHPNTTWHHLSIKSLDHLLSSSDCRQRTDTLCHCHRHQLAPTCFWWVPLDLHPVEGLCRRCALWQRWTASLQVSRMQRWQRVWAPEKRGCLLVPAAIGSMGILQLTQGGGTVTLAMLRDHGRRDVTRVHQWAALG